VEKDKHENSNDPRRETGALPLAETTVQFRNEVVPVSIPSSPTWGRTVEVFSGGFSGKLTVARHNVTGKSRFGQNSTDFPFCAINYAAWQECHFDLKDAHWFRTEEDAAALRFG
jgi:hypothetical protein